MKQELISRQMRLSAARTKAVQVRAWSKPNLILTLTQKPHVPNPNRHSKASRPSLTLTLIYHLLLATQQSIAHTHNRPIPQPLLPADAVVEEHLDFLWVDRTIVDANPAEEPVSVVLSRTGAGVTTDVPFLWPDLFGVHLSSFDKPAVHIDLRSSMRSEKIDLSSAHR